MLFENWVDCLSIMGDNVLAGCSQVLFRSAGEKVACFKNNLPGTEWVNSFMKRSNDLTFRHAQNIRKSRADVSPEVINKYFDNLEENIKDVSPNCILNYDEVNLTDDPKSKKMIFKRGCKHPDRVLNATKSSTSVMFAGTADGHMLPPHIVYKSENMWDTWTFDGPPWSKI